MAAARLALMAMAVAAAMTTLTVGTPLAATITVAGQSLDLPVPDGACALDDTRQPDREFWERMARIQNASQNDLRLLFVDCAELEAWRASPDHNFSHHGLVFTQRAFTSSGRLVSRAETIENFLQAFNRPGGITIDEEDVRRRVNAAVPGLGISGTASLGVLRRNDNAAYIGFLQTVSFQDVSRRVVSVTGITALNGIPIAAAFYREYDNADSVVTLLNSASTYVDRLVAVNPDLGGSSGGGWDWGRVAEKALIGAVVGGIIGLLAWGWTRFRRRGAE